MRLINKVQQFIANLRQKTLVRDSVWMLTAQGSSIIIQAAYFIIVARILGSEDYGEFVSITALAAIASPFAGLGGGDLLVKNVSRDQAQFSQYWGNALLILFTSSSILIFTIISAAHTFLPQSISLWVILLVLISDLIGLKLIDFAMGVFIATQNVKKAAQVKFLLSLSKLIAAALLIFLIQYSSADIWAVLYCASTILAALIAVAMVHSKLPLPKLALSQFRPDFFREGFYFSISASSDNINSSADKTLLASLATVQAAGIYGAAYRFIDVGYFPIHAIVGITYARFFQYGTKGMRGSLSFARRLVPMALCYGGLSMLCLLLFSPLVPSILGSEYSDAVIVLRWLSPIHLLISLQYLAANALTGAGFQGFRSGIQIISASINILLNFWLLPTYSWKGAVWSTLAADTFKLISLWALAIYLYRKQFRRLKTVNG